jgi:serine/threonine-protein kinase/endoribonuclease IRE1
MYLVVSIACRCFLVASIFAMLYISVHFTLKVQQYQQFSQDSQANYRSVLGDQSVAVTAVAEIVGGGIVQVGRITFNTNEILGNGCEGTFVFRCVPIHISLFCLKMFSRN